MRSRQDAPHSRLQRNFDELFGFPNAGNSSTAAGAAEGADVYGHDDFVVDFVVDGFANAARDPSLCVR